MIVREMIRRLQALPPSAMDKPLMIEVPQGVDAKDEPFIDPLDIKEMTIQNIMPGESSLQCVVLRTEE